MAGILDILTGKTNPGELLSAKIENDNLREEISYMGSEIHDLQESMLAISDAFDNTGWRPLTDTDAKTIRLETVKKMALVGRAMYTMNPFIKKGIRARYSYVWGRSVFFDGVSDIQDQLDTNRKKLFSPQAYEELEVTLATDGNVFTALDVSNKDGVTAFRVPLDEITGSVSNPYDSEDIWFYKRNYVVNTTNSQSGAISSVATVKYYMSVSYYNTFKKQGKALPKRFNKIGVEQNFVLHHMAVNKQVGWKWGIPDVTPVVFWAKAYKEYLEDNAMLVKAYSRLAWQVKASSVNGANAAASQLIARPTRDPFTGELNRTGGTAITGVGNELSPIQPTGSSVDFSKGSALAGAIASGLEIPLVVVTSSASDGTRATSDTLDLSTLKAMLSRQQLHTERFLEIFEFWGADVTPNPTNATKTKEITEAKGDTPGTGSEAAYAVITWPQIETDTTKDRIAAIGTAVELDVLYKQEARKQIIDILGIAPYKPWDDLPTMDDDPMAQQQAALQQSLKITNGNGQVIEKTAPPAPGAGPVIPKQGVSGGTSAKGGKLNTNNAARDNRAANKNNN